MISKLHYISQGISPNDHLENIQKACTAGAEWVQLRLKNSNQKTVLETAHKAREITTHFQTRLIINDYYKIAKEVKADGVHLGQTDSNPKIVREYLGDFFIIGGTANSLQDCEMLISKKVDYIGLGPYRYTTTKENLSSVIGINGYMLIIEALKSNIPIIAIGGITLKDVSKIMKTGVYGIAVSGGITNDFNSIPKFYKKLNDPSENEQIWRP